MGRHEQIANMNGDNLTLGTCYPEHWPKTMWREDLERMKRPELRSSPYCRICVEQKFSNRKRGVFTHRIFSDEFLDLADEVGTKVIFVRRQRRRPAWLADRETSGRSKCTDGW
ncbi:MAG: beta-galactosidase [Lachnospiraceae bacterium]